MGTKRLLLTHIPPWYDAATALDEARELYDGPIEVAVEGAVHQL